MKTPVPRAASGDGVRAASRGGTRAAAGDVKPRRRIAVAGLCALLGLAGTAGCQDAPTALLATDRVVKETPAPVPPALVASPADLDAVAAAVDDAVTRLVPSLDGAAGQALRSELDAVAAALAARDAAALAGATRQAADALMGARPSGAGGSPLLLHLDLIGLVLDRAAALVVTGDPTDRPSTESETPADPTSSTTF
jgi:hypothetical protein